LMEEFPPNPNPNPNPNPTNLLISPPILFFLTPIQISTYPPYFVPILKSLSSNKNFHFHHISCKSPANIYLPSILCFHLLPVTSNNQLPLSSYSLQISCKYPLTPYFVLPPIPCYIKLQLPSYSLQISCKYLLTPYFIYPRIPK
jgi:hypothetical protein